MKRRLFLVITFFYVVFAACFASFVVKDMGEFKTYKTKYSTTLNVNNTTFNVRNYLFTNEYKETEKIAEILLNQAEKHKSKAFHSFLWILAGSFVYLFVVGLFLYFKFFTIPFLGISILVVSFVFLVTGILVPMLEVSAYLNGVHLQVDTGVKDIPLLGSFLPDSLSKNSVDFDGKIYAFYQCKSVKDLIELLFLSKNYFVAITILFFSVIFPFAKLFLSVLLLGKKSLQKNVYLVDGISYIGKFSMVDVFVVSILLAYLAFDNMNPGVTTETHVLIGMYLFTGYCILSMLFFFCLKRIKN